MRERFPFLEPDDIIQETLLALCKVLPSYRYAPDEKGRFRNYLSGILKNKAMRALRKCKKEAKAMTAYAENGGRQNDHADKESETWRQSIFEIALRQFLDDESVADRTKRIFERTAIRGESPEEVAVSLKMTRHAVDQVKSRAISRIRGLVRELESLDK